MSHATENFILIEDGKETPVEVKVPELIIAGWTGSDVEAVEKHIEELAELGIPRPTTVPIYYRVAATRLTTADAIQVSGGESSGEAEAVLINIDGHLWAGVGSDHTDREAESTGIALSKQMCEKPVGPKLWPYDEVKDHWTELKLRGYAHIDGERVLYQEGTLAAMRSPEELIEKYVDGGSKLADGNLMFQGTLAAIGGIRPATRFEMELEDPVLNRTLSHGYEIIELPVAG